MAQTLEWAVQGLLPEAVERAKLYVTKAVRKHHRWPSRTGATDALNHSA